MTTEPDFSPEQFELGEPLATIPLDDDAATRALGAALAAAAEQSVFIGLVGTLGAGKTTLVQGLTNHVAPEQHVHSPTYTLVNVYDTSPTIVHIDLYRLESYDDLESIGYWDYIESYGAITCVEWFSMIPDSWPGEGVVVSLVPTEDGRRVASLYAAGDVATSMASCVSSALSAPS